MTPEEKAKAQAKANAKANRLYDSIRNAPTQRARAQAIWAALRWIWVPIPSDSDKVWIYIPFRRFPVRTKRLTTIAAVTLAIAGYTTGAAVTGHLVLTIPENITYLIITTIVGLCAFAGLIRYDTKRRKEYRR